MNRVASLRVSLLVSLGLVSFACGGNTTAQPDEEGGGTTSNGGQSNGGKPTKMGGAGGKMGGGGGTGASLVSCTSPQADPETGLVTCKEGYKHRPTVVDCSVVGGAPADATAGAGNADPPAPLPRADGSVECGANAVNCKAFELGYCSSGQFPSCRSGCISDSECGAGFICVCNGPSDHGGECQASNCTTDSDCGAGSRCASLSGACGSGAFRCQAANDECVSDADCGGSPCYFDQEKAARACFEGVCGRPFLVEANARVAAVVAGDAWLQSDFSVPNIAGLTARERATLAAHWTQMGQMEHASIAAFARFSLQLLALGAPPGLVEACTQALADETAHTKLCFALASSYAGRAIGPGPLDISHSLELNALADIVDLVIAEGCFGETSAALQALEAADNAEDPAIVAAYSRIARDEQRHAELAFRFVRWALEQDRGAVAPRIHAALAEPSSSDAAACAVALPCLSRVLESALSGVESGRAA